MSTYTRIYIYAPCIYSVYIHIYTYVYIYKSVILRIHICGYMLIFMCVFPYM